MPEAANHTERLRKVLAVMGIRRACFVDDLFSPNFPEAFSLSRTLALKGGTAEVTTVWCCGTWTTDTEEDDRADAERKWEELDLPARVALHRHLRVLSPGEKGVSETTFFRMFGPRWSAH